MRLSKLIIVFLAFLSLFSVSTAFADPDGDMDMSIYDCSIARDNLVLSLDSAKATNDALLDNLNNLKQSVRDDLSNMSSYISNRAGPLNSRMRRCFNLMSNTAVCVPPSYNAATEWPGHDISGLLTDLRTNKSDLQNKIPEIDDLINNANDRSSRLNAISIPACEFAEAIADSIQADIDAISTEISSDSADKDALETEITTIINDFTTNYASLITRVTSFLARTEAIMQAHSPITIAAIRLECGYRRGIARRERNARRRVRRCLRALSNKLTSVNNLPALL